MAPLYAPARRVHVNTGRRRIEYQTARIRPYKELSLAIQRSREMKCGMCLEVILDKDNPSERRFGILPNCSHCFCLTCIRSWRSVKCLPGKGKCPACRTRSPFFVQSDYWVKDEVAKRELIKRYKDRLASIPCRYFNGGYGTCKLNTKCFYKHKIIAKNQLQPWQRCRPQLWHQGKRMLRRWKFTEPLSDTDDGESQERETYQCSMSEMLLRLLANE